MAVLHGSADQESTHNPLKFSILTPLGLASLCSGSMHWNTFGIYLNWNRGSFLCDISWYYSVFFPPLEVQWPCTSAWTEPCQMEVQKGLDEFIKELLLRWQSQSDPTLLKMLSELAIWKEVVSFSVTAMLDWSSQQNLLQRQWKKSLDGSAFLL